MACSTILDTLMQIICCHNTLSISCPSPYWLRRFKIQDLLLFLCFHKNTNFRLRIIVCVAPRFPWTCCNLSRIVVQIFYFLSRRSHIFDILELFFDDNFYNLKYHRYKSSKWYKSIQLLFKFSTKIKNKWIESVWYHYHILI